MCPTTGRRTCFERCGELGQNTGVLIGMTNIQKANLEIDENRNRRPDRGAISDAPSPAASVMLMAGGRGERLMPLSNAAPKPMLHIGDRLALEPIICSFVDHGLHNIFISVHYMGDVIENHFGDGAYWGANISYIREATPLGTAGSLKLLPANLDKPVIVMNADIVSAFDITDLLARHSKSGADATVTTTSYKQTIPFGVIRQVNGQILEISERPTSNFDICAGIYVLSPNALSYLPEEQRHDMPEFLNALNDADCKIVSYDIQSDWMDIGTIEDYRRAQILTAG